VSCPLLPVVRRLCVRWPYDRRGDENLRSSLATVRNRACPGSTGMNTHHTHLNTVSVDDLWLADWVAEGITALERYLAKQAAFAAFLAARDDLDSTHGDRAGR
jgi:hypothetical protein